MATTLYATSWTWVRDPWKNYPYGLQRGWWVATGWSTDPALAVPQVTLAPCDKPIRLHLWPH